MTGSPWEWPTVNDRETGDLPAFKRLCNERFGKLRDRLKHVQSDLGWVNVKDFGVSGNGASDDSAKITRARVEAAAMETTLYFPPGRYRYDTPILLSGDGTRILGAGRHATILEYTGTGGEAIQIAGAGQRGAVVDSLRIECLGSAATAIAASSNIGQVELLNLQLNPSATGKGVDLSAGNSSLTYLRNVRCGGGDVGFDFTSIGIANNTINAKNCFVSDSGSFGYKTSNVLCCILDGCAADARDTAFQLGGFSVSLIGCSCESNTVRGYFVAGTGSYVFLNCAAVDQVEPWVVDAAGASVVWLNPRSLVTPSGSSIRVVSMGQGIVINDAALDAGYDAGALAAMPEVFGGVIRCSAGASTLATSPTTVGQSGGGYRFNGSSASGSDVAAGDVTLQAPRSTGTASPGRVTVEAGRRTASGAAVQSLYTALIAGINDGTLFDTYLNSPASPDAVRLIWAFNAVIQAIAGVSGSAAQIIAGSAVGDLCLRTQGGRLLLSTDSGSTLMVELTAAGALKVHGPLYQNEAAALLHAETALTNGAGAAAGTLANAPAAGDPTKWIPIDDAGTTRYVPAW